LLLIAAFAIYVIVKKRVRITRSTTITGSKAQTFGALLLILPIPFSSLMSALFRLLPSSARVWPVPQTAYGLVFGVVVLSMAYYFRDKSTVALPVAPVPGDLPTTGQTPAG
jgi:hypothetical protein